MNQRKALIVSAAITAFVLVIIGGLAARLSMTSPAQPVEAAPVAAPAEVASAGAIPAGAPVPVTYPVSADQAAQVALNAEPGTSLTADPVLVNFEGTVAYEVALDRGNVYVDAGSAAILFDGAALPPEPVTAEQAAAAAQAYVGGGEVTEVERENERGADVFAVEFADGSEVYVDVASGQVVYAELSGSQRGGEHDDDDHGAYEDDEHGEDD